MHFALTYIENECYTFRNEMIDVSNKKEVREYTKRVMMPYHSIVSKSPFPYLVVNIGSGVSILKISAPGRFERVSGSSVGGGTYWGLCRLLVPSKTTYEELLELAEQGDPSHVDMLVKDIYGGGYDSMNLSGSMVASSFGKLVMKEYPRDGTKEEDLAIALLMMITNNIGQVAHLNAQLHGCSKIFFVGSFLRHNSISCRRLAFAIDFWSKGATEALFLQHEGYFGALGTFLRNAMGKDVEKLFERDEDISFF
jgi:type II pantothenate kinase